MEAGIKCCVTFQGFLFKIGENVYVCVLAAGTGKVERPVVERIQHRAGALPTYSTTVSSKNCARVARPSGAGDACAVGVVWFGRLIL